MSLKKGVKIRYLYKEIRKVSSKSNKNETRGEGQYSSRGLGSINYYI